jgi:hypothetical protein
MSAPTEIFHSSKFPSSHPCFLDAGMPEIAYIPVARPPFGGCNFWRMLDDNAVTNDAKNQG